MLFSLLLIHCYYFWPNPATGSDYSNKNSIEIELLGFKVGIACRFMMTDLRSNSEFWIVSFVLLTIDNKYGMFRKSVHHGVQPINNKRNGLRMHRIVCIDTINSVKVRIKLYSMAFSNMWSIWSGFPVHANPFKEFNSLFSIQIHFQLNTAYDA